MSGENENMSAGTIKLTNGSTAVVGTSTTFTTDLKSGDVITTTIGGVFYTLFVDTVTSNTALTVSDAFTGPTTIGAAYVAVPQMTLNRITAALAAQTAEAVRRVLQDNANWQAFYSGSGNITITVPNGTPTGLQITGPSWKKISDLANSADLNAIQVLATQTAADAASASASKAASKTSETNAKTSETNAKTSETNAKSSETNAAASLAAAQLLTSVPYEDSPIPDFWMPLSDDMLMLTGQGPYDRLTIGNQYVELTTRSATFTRASTATYFDKTGFMVTAANNEPRFEKPGLLMEGRATNQYLYSETWSSGIGTTVTNNSALSPKNDMTAALFQETTSNGEHYVGDRSLPLTAGTNYCFSAFVSAAAGGRSLYVRVASGTTGGAIFNPVTGDWAGSLVGANATDRGFEYIGNGIYRVWVVINAAATQTSVIRLQVTNGVTSSYAGDGSSGVNVWGAQFEEGTFPTSYIKTDSAAVTRAADFWSVPVANVGYRTLAQQFNRTVAFNIYPKFISSVASEYVDVATARGARNDIICRPNTGNRLSAYRSSGGLTIQTDSNAQGTYVLKTSGDTITSYFANKSSTSTVSPVSTAEVPVELTNSASTVAKFVYYIKNLRIWQSALTDNQIKGLR